MSPREPHPVDVLLCDDATSERTALAAILKAEGYQVHEATNGDTALQLLKEHEIDLVLLDLNMPQVDGFEVLGYLQEHRRSLPVILLSGMPLNQIQQRIHGLPRHELPMLLVKPINPEMLLDMMEMQLSGEIKPWAEGV